ncbi:uncharacterized protein LOC110450902 [Mizuhopecten yessoensis]|uniref:uncharacterized protein LOC110450902 n=1 Tax=Mizuhopecten yessoensis TaxID=6573 RepID=UPI000B458F32|nr:uncharacterized protein LOC110450902 [Mizuhopecten yessoensis]
MTYPVPTTAGTNGCDAHEFTVTPSYQLTTTTLSGKSVRFWIEVTVAGQVIGSIPTTQTFVFQGAVTLNGSAEYAIHGNGYNLTCTVPDEATRVSFYRRPLMTVSPQDIQVTGDQCYILVSGTPVLCTPDVCSCQPSALHYATVFRLVLQPRPADHNSIWFCRRQNSNLTNEYEDSTDYTLQVLEEVTSIVLQNPPSTLQEHQSIFLVCVTSPCRPAATVLWSVGGVNYTSFSTSTLHGSGVSMSRLTFTITRTMDGKTVVCSAYNTDVVVTSKIQPMLDVQYGPDTSIALSPVDVTYTVDEGDTLPDITCTAGCRPGCTFVWTKPDNNSFTSSAVLSLGQLDRSENGTYQCTAQNTIGTSTIMFSLHVRCKLCSLYIETYPGGGLMERWANLII